MSAPPLPFVSLNGATATGVGTEKDLEGTFGTHYLAVFVTGSPATYSVALECSHDGVHWSAVGTASNGGTIVQITDLPVRYVRANLTTLTGGSSPTVTATIGSL